MGGRLRFSTLHGHEDVQKGGIDTSCQNRGAGERAAAVAREVIAVVCYQAIERHVLSTGQSIRGMLSFRWEILVVVIGDQGKRQDGERGPRIVERGKEEKNDQEVLVSPDRTAHWFCLGRPVNATSGRNSSQSAIGPLPAKTVLEEGQIRANKYLPNPAAMW
jgi:hypothetical protein